MAHFRRGRRKMAFGVPALVLGTLAIVALLRVGGPVDGESGAAGTMGVRANRDVSLEDVPVRQLTSPRTFWVGEAEDEPTFVVADEPVSFEPGTRLTIVGRIAPAPALELATREWRVHEATAQAVRERGVYIRATDIRPAPQP